MHKSTFYLMAVVLLTAVVSSAVVCPPGTFDNPTAGFCMDCLLDTACGTNPECPNYLQKVDSTTSVCALIPACPDGTYFDKAGATAADQICKPCSGATQTQCDLCPGYFFDTTANPNVCQVNPDCAADTYFVAESCQACNGAVVDLAATPIICGNKNGCYDYFVNSSGGSPICSPCYSIPFVDLTLWTQDTTYCGCQTGYYWDTTNLLCADCASTTITDVNCKLCANFVWNAVDGKCLGCASIPSSSGFSNFATGGCGCQPGFTWDAVTFACIDCATATTDVLCGQSTCLGFYFEAASTQCLLCSSVDSTNSTVNDAAFGKTSCVCIADNAWVATAGTTPGSCTSCSTITVEADCSATACPNFLWDTATPACGDQCTATTSAGNGVSPGPISNGMCECLATFYWNSTTRVCTPCKGSTNQTVCQSDSCVGYLWLKTKCGDCSDVTNVDTTNPPGLTDVNGACTCKINYRWNSTTFACDSCTTAPALECAQTTCTNFFLSNNTCKLCSAATTDPRLPSTPYTACECKATFIWSTLTNACITCNKATSALNLLTNACVSCVSTTTNNYNGTNSSTPYQCVCKTGYIWFNGSCGCNSTKFEFDKGSGAGCSTCNLFPGGTTYNATTKGCNCVSGATWNTVLKKCVCNGTANYLFNNVCTPCSSLGKGVTTGNNPTMPDQCTCTFPTWTWSTTLKTCVCIDANSIYIKNATSVLCDSCTKMIYYSNGTRTSASTCGCRVGMVWSTNTTSCVCDGASVPFNGSKSVCISCPLLFGSTGAKVGNTCVCKTGWNWNATLGNCVCTSTSSVYCQCNPGFVLNVNKICVNCSLIPGATGFALSNTVCACVKSYTWAASTSTCDCPKGAFTNAAKSFCRFCDSHSNSTGKFFNSSNTTCACHYQHKWNPTTLQCEFATGPTITNIFLLNGTNVSCKNFPNSSLVALDNFNCKCPTDKIWNSYIPDCVPCSSIVNSTGKATNVFSCGCKTGSYWDVLSFSCKLNTCKYPLTDSRCTYCPKHAGVLTAAQLLIVTAAEKTILLSGDGLFSHHSNLGSPMYLNYTSYKCLCATNYTWSAARRKCYNRTLNGTA